MRSLILSNGSLLVTLNASGEVSDLYYPHPGLENHTGGLLHRLGIHCDGAISWLSEDPHWEIRVECGDDSLESNITAINSVINVSLSFKDIVYNESPIFLRQVTVKNLAPYERDIRLYFAHEFRIGNSHGGDTAFFDPTSKTIVHYKSTRAFLINGECEGASFSEYAIGHSRFDGTTGTFRDAEDGSLSGNSIEHGNVDSIIGFYQTYAPGEEKIVRYWLAVGESIKQVLALNAYVLKKTPTHLLQTAGNFWRAWINRYQWDFYKMSPQTIALFKKSLMLVRAHVDDDGGIIASADEEVLKHEEDTYAYVWMRDAAYAASALDRAGDPNVAERFFKFCNAVISSDGYFLHKYLPNRSLGSSWHPWIRNGIPQLPIQEDETSIVIWALAQHYRHSRDLEFIETLYNPLIEKAADFLASYRDPITGLPLASYDLWEERRGVSTYTSASVFGALSAAADIASVLGKEDRAQFYRTAAQEVREGIVKYLVSSASCGFVKMLEDGSGGEPVCNQDTDISSAYGLFLFGVLDPNDPLLVNAFKEATKRLCVNGGIGRYENDRYYAANHQSNPWFITTLWYAEFLIARAQNEEDFVAVYEIFEWVASHAQSSGVLSEQIATTNGTQRSVAPLMWSHAAYVNAVLCYLDRLAELGICEKCNPVP